MGWGAPTVGTVEGPGAAGDVPAQKNQSTFKLTKLPSFIGNSTEAFIWVALKVVGENVENR